MRCIDDGLYPQSRNHVAHVLYRRDLFVALEREILQDLREIKPTADDLVLHSLSTAISTSTA
jgi:hypothetical protein